MKHKTFSLLIIFAVLLMVSPMIVFAGRASQTDKPTDPIPTKEVNVRLQNDPSKGNGLPVIDRTLDHEALLSVAQEQGDVRVIVGLAVDFTPEGELRSPLSVNQQQRQIARVQEVVLKSLPGDVTVNAQYKIIPYMALTVDEVALQALIQSPEIDYIHQDRLSVPMLGSTIALIGGDQVHAQGIKGSDWTVAVLDTGVQWDHEFMGGAANSRVIDEACFSTTDAGYSSTSICATAPHEADPDTALCMSGATNICTHGTHVAGIVAGSQTYASVNYDGVAPDANVMAVQVFSRFPAGSTECGVTSTIDCVLSYESDQISALQYVYSQRTNFNIAAVNMSLGGGQYFDQAACDLAEAATKAAIDTLRSADIATIIASGNDGFKDSIGGPGCISTAVAVGATNDSDVVASFSNSSDLVDLLAPGVFVDSSVPPDNGIIYDNYQGTSMATPHVAGAWVLLKQMNPTGSVADILTTLQTTGVVIADTNGISIPRIQLDAALATLPAGNIAGTITDSNSSLPILNATVNTIGSAQLNASNDANGDYVLTAPAGTYDVTASAYGYQPDTQIGVAVSNDVTTTVDFSLTPVTTYQVSGYITDADTGWPLYASVDITPDGFPPLPTIWSDPETGYYSVNLISGVPHTFNVSAWVDGYTAATRTVGPLAGPVTEDFDLTADVNVCLAPGYDFNGIFLEESFDDITSFPDAGWAQQVIADSGSYGSPDWNTDTAANDPDAGNVGSTHSGARLAVFNSYSSDTGDQARLYRTSGLDLNSLSIAEVSFWVFHYQYYSANDQVQLQISTDGGNNWNNVGATVLRDNGTTGWAQYTRDISAYTGSGMTDVRIGFLGESDWGNDLHIDDVLVSTSLTCSPSLGGLVVGNVYDGNTSAALNGASVANEDGYSTTSAATPDDPNVEDGFYTLFSPAGGKLFTASATNYADDVDTVAVVINDTVRHDFYLDAGLLSYTPAALEATIPAGTSTIRPFTITNSGSAAANFQLFEISGSTSDVLQDGGFEGGTPNSDWNEASTNFGTPICDLGSCFADVARSGTFWLWFGGADSTEIGSVDQDVVIPTGTATLAFWLLLGDVGAVASMDVSIDGDVLFSVTEADAASYPTYTEVTIDVSAYADGGSHNVRFESTEYGTVGNYFNFHVDDVSLNVEPGIPWLSEAPVSGIIAATTDQPIDVTFDATGLALGQYTGQLVVAHDTPSVLQNVPVTLTVFTGYLWNGSVNTDWNNASNWTPNGVPSTLDSVVVDPVNLIGVSVWPVLNINSTIADLTVEAGAELTIPENFSLSVNGTLTNNGLLRQTINNVNSATTFLGMGGYGGVEITPAGNMGSTTVEIRGNQDCTTDPTSQPVRRCFDITPTTARSATIRFYYLPSEANGNLENGIIVYHWDGSGWNPESGITTPSNGDDPSWVEVEDVSSYSPFVLDNTEPTAVSLAQFVPESSSPVTAVLLTAILLILMSLSIIVLKRKKFL